MFLKLFGCRVVTLVNDNFAARYNIKPTFYTFLKKLEVFSYKFLSNACIFPDISRFKLLDSPNISNVFYLPNVLETSAYKNYEGAKGKELIVLFCGWLVESRGLELLPDLLRLTHRDIKFTLLGPCSENQKKLLGSDPRIRFHNQVSRHECLEFMSTVDLTFAFYNPKIPINRVALPQKVYDAVLVGCPIFINSEIEMVKSLIETGGCLTEKYFDVEKIAGQLNGLLKDKSKLTKMANKLKDSSYRKETTDFLKINKLGTQVYKRFLDI